MPPPAAPKYAFAALYPEIKRLARARLAQSGGVVGRSETHV